ncbi:MAG: hypothetical protein M3072_08415 [Candidatus Dormibacteraeota bacterium]|nr:hypothetical protein [Candidatus Dormibacteraeota bacterium]
MSRQDLLAKVLLALAFGSGGAGFVVGHLAVASTPPATVALLRYLIAVGLFALILTQSRQHRHIPNARDLLRIAGMYVSAYSPPRLGRWHLGPSQSLPHGLVEQAR